MWFRELMRAGERPVVDPLREHESPPEVPEIVRQDAQRGTAPAMSQFSFKGVSLGQYQASAKPGRARRRTMRCDKVIAGMVGVRETSQRC